MSSFTGEVNSINPVSVRIYSSPEDGFTNIQLPKFSSSFLAKLLSSEEAVTNTAPFLSVFINPPSKSYIDPGRQMFRDWLRLTALGYYGAPISSLTDNKETSKKLLNSINHKSDDEIIFVMRCGRPDGEIPQSGRLTLDRIRF